jgi:hypothetical protein
MKELGLKLGESKKASSHKSRCETSRAETIESRLARLNMCFFIKFVNQIKRVLLYAFSKPISGWLRVRNDASGYETTTNFIGG